MTATAERIDVWRAADVLLELVLRVGLVERQDYARIMRAYAPVLDSAIEVLVENDMVVHRVSGFDGLDTLRVAG